MPDTPVTSHKPYLIYLLALLTGITGMWAAMWGQYYVFLIPVAIAVLLMSIYKTEKFILLTGALAPLSVNVNDIGG